MKRILIAGISALILCQSGWAREPNNLDDIQRETRIVADVMRSSLSDKLRQSDLRLTDLKAEYLARQGVLVSVTLNTPWLKIDQNGNANFEFHGNLSLPEIPALVENILHDLQLNVTPYEPEALEDLRSLREEQRELRTESREIRARLREKRRELIREDLDHRKLEIEGDINQLEQELQLADQQYENLTAEIDQQYQRLKDYRETVKAPGAPLPPGATPAPGTQQVSADPVSVEQLIADTVCDYGSTLKALSSENYLTVSLKRGKQTQYYAFEMDHVYQCGSNSMRSDRMLELAYQYAGTQ